MNIEKSREPSESDGPGSSQNSEFSVCMTSAGKYEVKNHKNSKDDPVPAESLEIVFLNIIHQELDSQD